MSDITFQPAYGGPQDKPRTQFGSAQPAPAAQPTTQEAIIRGALFLAVFFFFWISLKAFPDLRDPRVLLPNLGGDTINQAAALTLATLCLAYAVLGDMRRYLILLSVPFTALLVWMVISAGLSPYPALAAKKLVLAFLIALQAATLLLLPVSLRHFALLITVGLGTTLIISYIGILFWPHLAIHQPTEMVEPQLAGNWRGSFQHKNEAGTASILMIFFAIFIWRTRSALAGSLILGGAFLLLANTGSKTPMGLLALTLAISWLMLTASTAGAKVTIAVCLVAIPAAFTIGSAMVPAVHAAIGAIGLDPTFTDRTEIWQFAIGEALQRPIRGHGFQAFWGTGDVFNSGSSIETWANRATNAHNAYIEAFLLTGLPGLVLLLIWMVTQPAKDLARAQALGADHALNALYVNVWVYALLSASLESVFFVGGGPVWITTLIAIFGLRYQATSTLARGGSTSVHVPAPPAGNHTGQPT